MVYIDISGYTLYLGQQNELTRPTNEPPTTIIFRSEVAILEDEV